MRKTLMFIAALVLSCTLVWGDERNADEAAAIAASFMNAQPAKTHARRAPQSAGTVRLAHTVARPQTDRPAFYIFNSNNNEGFVLVSAEDNAVTVLGYSDEGAFDASNIPSNVQFWFDYYAERIAAAQPAGPKAKSVRKVKSATAISPLLGNIKWDQGTPYNDLCPMDKQTKAYTGCVATAAAQIMRYYKWPETGQGSHTDNWTSDAGKSGTSFANFGETTYDWDNMLESYNGSYTTAQATAVATLMFHVGVSCDMQYGGDESNGSGAYTDDMGKALVSYFRYKNTASYKSGLSTSQLTTLFTSELQAGRPILMGGSSNDGGHEFVCDGIDADGYFHINWGWGGVSNGFFALSALDPDQQGAGGSTSGDGFSQDIDCVVGIEPDRDPVSVTSVTVSPATLTLKIKERAQLSAAILPENASNKGLAWSSSNENVAKVSALGAVVGVSTGTATITATTYDGNKTSTCTVTVTDEIAAATLLDVNTAAAEYDDQYEEPWTIHAYNADNAGSIPYIMFWPDGKSSNKIAGTYTLGTPGGVFYNDPSNENAYIQITSGQLAITCVGKDNGANGCNTYRVLSYFTCDDGAEYKVDATLEICAQDADENAIDLADNVGDGEAAEVIWLANGAQFASNLAVNGKLTIPAEKPAACDASKVFVGWSAAEISETDEAPSFAKTGDAITTDAVYHAVYATAEGGSAPAEVASVTFKTASSDSNEDAAGKGTIATTLVSASTGISSFSGAKVYAGIGGAKLGSSKAKGSITLTLASTVSVSSVKVNASTYGSDSGKLQVTAGATSLGSQSPANNLTYVADPAVETNTITVETTSKRAYISSISVIAGSTKYAGYTTSCDAATKIEVPSVEQSAQKILRNGQLLILKGDKIYTITGQETIVP